MLSSLLSILASSALLASADQTPLKPPATYPFTPAFDKLVEDSLGRWRCPGLAVAVIDGDETFSKGYGIGTFPFNPVTPHTLFYTASTTKSFTAAAISLLIDEATNSASDRELYWNTPLADVIRDDFVLPDEYTTLHATLEDALSHRTGMPRHDLTYGGPNTTVRDVVRNLRNLPMTAEIRTKWQYCNMMYITLSHVIETWTGIGLGDFLRTRIYEPLGMHETFFSLKEAQAATPAGNADLATPYYWKNYTQDYHSLPWLDSPQEYVPSGAGATISNVLDYTKWLRCHMTASPPLSSAAHLSLHTPRMISNPTLTATGFRGADTYALGWAVSNYRGEEMQWHTGGLPGMLTIMLYLPRLQWGMTMMGNGGDGGAHLVLMFAMLDERMGVPTHERVNWWPFLEAKEAQSLESLKNAEDNLYPNTPKGKDAISLPLPLSSYAGKYTSPGYPPLHLTLSPNSTTTLHCTLSYEVWPIFFSFTHISASYFLLYARFFTTAPRAAPDDYGVSTDVISKAEFRLNEVGEVAALGVLLEPEMGLEKIWWRKEGAKGTPPLPNSPTANSPPPPPQADTNHAPLRSLFSAKLTQNMAPLFSRHG